jgi:DNA-binding MarR family transcriptional regulator
MQATATARKAGREQDAKVSPEAHETAARLGALLRYVFLFDGGRHLRAIEESGLTMTQVKGLLMLRGVEEEHFPVTDLAGALGASVATVSRAVDALLQRKLVTRVEDEHDRRVRRVAITSKGRELADALIAARMAGLEEFAATLTAAQRRKLDAAVETLLDRQEITKAYAQLKKVAP